MYLYLMFSLICTNFCLTIYNCDRSSVTCGCSENPAILSKIVGGEESIPNSFGWVVSIRMYSSHVCGGSIISDFWIITAAHCIPSNYVFGSFSIMAGIQNLSDIGQERLIVESFVHPQYDPDTFDNDIALVRLNLPLDMTHRSLAIICLPIINNTLLDFQEYPSPGTPLVGIGWGTLMSNNTEPSETLQQVTLETIANYRAFCMSIIHNVTLQFCAGIDGGGKDTCQGDSGGPIMMFRSTGQWELVGLTSYGEGCGLPEYAGVYTRLAYYQLWIENITNMSDITISTTQTSFIITEVNNGTFNSAAVLSEIISKVIFSSFIYIVVCNILVSV